MTREDVEFKTFDGLTLRGWLYPALSHGPALIMTQGFNTPKEILLPDIALWFQQQGLTVLLFDTRTIGASDGEPRNDIQPSKLVEDYHDALTFLVRHPLVNPDNIVYFGYSFSAMIVLAAAALDKRVAAVLSVTPIANYNFRTAQRDAVLDLAQQDRVSQLAGNPPVYIPFVNDEGENPAGWGEKYSVEEFQRFLGTFFFTNQTTVQSYYHLNAWSPYHTMHLVSPTPVMMVTPAEDNLSTPENQRKLFDMIGEPKVFELVSGKGHMDVLNGDGAEQVLSKMLDFLKEHLEW
ncbi:Alpha/Beta hydrolase protein [Phaeosphaeriaceae sp. PMI808]|nr:Alpha/Beta hydrolase protein [Phaeosphaeriaceae sp. PMI808]